MPVPKSVVELLVAQPEDVLHQMMDGLKAEIDRLQAERALVEVALSRTARRRRSPSSSSERETTPRTASAGLKRADLLLAVAEHGRPVSPLEIAEKLRSRGMDIATAAVRTGMSRLVKDGKLTRLGEGLYAVNYGASTNGAEKNEADSPLSLDSQLQRQNSEAS